jgi:hypothetical protein
MPFFIVGIIFPQKPREFERLRRIFEADLEQMNKDKDACVAIVNPTVERCQMFVKQNGRRLDKLSLIQYSTTNFLKHLLFLLIPYL